MAKMKYIYMAGPLGPTGGGMLRVTDYLVQAQHNIACYDHARMVKLDTRGTGNAMSSIWVLSKAIAKVLAARLRGEIAGVHVNMAERLSIFRKGLLLGVCRLAGIPTVLHLHAAQLESSYASNSPMWRFLTKRVFLLASHVVVLGENSRRFVVQEMGVAPSRVDVVINGVPPPSLVRRVKADVVRRQILFLGNLSQRKGVADLLRALAGAGLDPRDCEVCIAGGGAVDAYREQASKLGLDALVTFAGWVNQEKAAAVIANADLLVLPSYDEGLPLVVLEALGNGVAVICTPVGEIPHVLTDGVDVLFVVPGDVAGIEKALRRVLDDADFRSRLEVNGRKAYEEKFSLERFSGRVAEIHDATFGLSAAGGSSRPAAVGYR